MNGDSQLRDILPLLRPRSAEPTLFSQVVWYLLWSGVALLLALYVTRWISHRRRRAKEFNTQAAAMGLSARQTALLYKIARSQRMQSPPRLLTSARVFDRQAGAYADGLAARDRQHPELAAIGQVRSDLSFDDLDLDQSLSSTRQMDRGQTVMIWAEDGPHGTEGFVPWLVLERDEAALTLAPVLRTGEEPETQFRRGEEITGRFWREGDTEYRFVTEILRKGRSEHALDVRHATVERMQHRDFYRIDVDFPADFLVLPAVDDQKNADTDVMSEAAIELLDQDQQQAADEPEVEVDRFASATRVRGRVVNLSAGGLAIDVSADGPAAEEGSLWIVSPTFEGQFALAELTCVPVSTEPAPGGERRIKMRFEELPRAAEKDIVRGVYEHQLQAAGGRGTTPTQLPSTDEDDLPTPEA